MQKFDVVIIGSGLGGLICGNILSREGYNVCVIEKNNKIGGCLQIFSRDKCIFNTGLNYTEGLAEGQILNKYFSYFGIMNKLKLRRMDMDGFEVITFKDNEYKFAQEPQHFIETLSQSFPNEKQTLHNYINKLKSICDSFPLFDLNKNSYNINSFDVFNESAYGYLNSLTSNKILQNVLAGNNLLYGGVPDKTPLYIHALIIYSFINSSWRLVDGSAQLASLLAESIKNNGGTILLNQEVKEIISVNKVIKSVRLTDGQQIKANQFISNIHPVNTLKMLDDSAINKAFRNRIHSLENTIGMFTVYLVMKENTFRYMNHNHYYYDEDSVWTTATYDKNEWPQSFMLYTPAVSKSEIYADSVIAMSYMKYDELKQWEQTTVESRGNDYLEFKQRKAEQLIQLIEKKFPGIKSKIKNYYTSTPLTYRDYTGTQEGSSYGILKDFNNPLKSIILPKTKIKNLFFTGQNLNLHGILGVTISAVMTCGELTGMDYLIKKINAN